MNTVNPPTEDRSQSRASFHSGVTWREAIADFLLQTRGSREENTARFYEERLRLLARWGEENGLALADVQARHLRQYLAHRATCGISDMTRRHDAIAARVFLKFCKREDYVEGDPLAGYQVLKAERAYVKSPSDDEIRTLLLAMHDRWKPASNPSVRFIRPAARQFFSRRNYAQVTGLVETGARIGEMLALMLTDARVAAQDASPRRRERCRASRRRRERSSRISRGQGRDRAGRTRKWWPSYWHSKRGSAAWTTRSQSRQRASGSSPPGRESGGRASGGRGTQPVWGTGGTPPRASRSILSHIAWTVMAPA